ncbi:helix-turn-helix transcriptional regulator [Lelliottia sp. V106_10]|uniref:Helix-turn-helix transcriptional regulator n=1 Tax=Lelliottia wanjuensis TaxID=3050585 RepID=A0AAP4FYC0_9ENTR|nr:MULTISPECIES: helix-turn-helix transcriptional regulator [unclassified Lelliottia]MDI3362065.1 helix-turn-helix transcriptional regulator [Lelliottia sp. V89_13]MDK9356558.1 helix-turn-helix transcriptional regulator [Lelliottia sp. V106_16]MDK9365964.1 helix-turn-helix transcriptional regulator [Lelliottia sp. V106_12]MDK9372686.1 helix-turn-helix transcriptional regulator [Lelliottia sp. V106_10]MDK9597814.1 helix-turn-helix transcriptional regulator [Lelliottia sp. V89_10]
MFIDRKSDINEVLLCLSTNHSHLNYRLKVKLSKNEGYVLSCLQEGLDTREIGERLGVDIKSVYASRLRLMNKMQVGNRIDLYQNIVRQ